MPEVGQVAKLNGSAWVTGSDGATRLLATGDPVSQGDRIETAIGSELTIVFSDGTNFYLADEASMVLDELVYDPAGADNAVSLQLIQGLFVLVAGEAAKTGGMLIETPTGQIGIRGTTVGIFIDPATGATTIANLSHPLTGEVGRFVFINTGGTTIFSTENQELVVFDSISGHAPLVVRSPADSAEMYGRGIQVLRQSGELRRSDDDDGTARPTQAAMDDVLGDGTVGGDQPLSGGSGTAAGLTAAMASLTSRPTDREGDSGLIGLLSASSNQSTPSSFTAASSTGSSSDATAGLYIGFVWSGTAGDGLWQSDNWYIGGQPADGDDVRIEEGGAQLSYFTAPADSLLVSSLSLQGSTLSVQSGKLGVQDLFAAGDGASLRIEGGTFASNGMANSTGNITVQSGSLEITGGAFHSHGTFSLESGANIHVTGGSFENTGSMTINENMNFSGNRDLINGGSLHLGSGITTLSLNGNFQQLAEGTTFIQIGSGSHDLVNIAGTAQLSGKLGVELLGGYIPNAGDTFIFLTAAQIQVAFGDFVNEDITASREFKFSPTNTFVELIASDKPSNGADQIYGTSEFDFLRGFAGDDQIFGGADKDTLQGDDGADQLDGGAGSDTASFASSPSGVIANLSGTTQMGVPSGQASDGYGNFDTLANIENLDGSGSDDFLFGGSLDNFLDGHHGSDQLTGDVGSDTFGLRQGDGGPAIGNADVITDYSDGTDLFGLLDGLSFAALTIDDGGGSDTRISITSTGEFLAVVQGVTDNFLDASDFVTL